MPRKLSDPDFHKGETAYGRAYGDPSAAHPNLGPLEQPPFYAMKVHIGSLGTFAGLAINQHAQALDTDRQPIKGLYAVGNDAASFTGGDYIGAGITLGPALTFGYLAAHHAAGRAVAASQPAANGRRRAAWRHGLTRNGIGKGSHSHHARWIAGERRGRQRHPAGRVIDGLYAAGRTAVGLCAIGYFSGVSLSDGVFSGRRAGEAASARAARLHDGASDAKSAATRTA